MTTYRLSHGNNGSAFKHAGTYTLDDFPAELRKLAEFLRANPDVADVGVTRGDGSNLVIRREGSDG